MFKGKSTILPSHTESQDMARQFAQFFNDKTDGIRDEIQESGSPDVTPPQMDCFAPVSQIEMHKIILHSNSKRCSLERIQISLIKSYLDVLLPIIINLSLQASYVPDNF